MIIKYFYCELFYDIIKPKYIVLILFTFNKTQIFITSFIQNIFTVKYSFSTQVILLLVGDRLSVSFFPVLILSVPFAPNLLIIKIKI